MGDAFPSTTENELCYGLTLFSFLGKKNWLFIGEAEAGERGAILYTIIECCRRRGMDPYSYLRDVLTRLPDMTNWQVPEVTPAAWVKAQGQAIPLKAAS